MMHFCCISLSSNHILLVADLPLVLAKMVHTQNIISMITHLMMVKIGERSHNIQVKLKHLDQYNIITTTKINEKNTLQRRFCYNWHYSQHTNKL